MSTSKGGRVRTPGDKVVIGGEVPATSQQAGDGSRPPTGILKPGGRGDATPGSAGTGSRMPSRDGVAIADSGAPSREAGPSRSGPRGVSRGSTGASSSDSAAASLARQQAIANTKQEELKAKVGKLQQKEREAQRKRDEALRSKEKEKELKRLEEEREREEVLEKQRALEQRREANVNAKLVQRERVAEHQEQIMLEFTLRTKEMGDKRQAAYMKHAEAILERHSVGEFQQYRQVEKKMIALRRVFVLLDYDGDGLISEEDLMKRMKSLNVVFDEEDVEVMFDDVNMMYGYETSLGGRDANFWRWGLKMYQPDLVGKVDKAKALIWSPGWSRAATGANSMENSLNGSLTNDAGHKRPDSSSLQRDIMRLFRAPPTRKHHDMIRNHNLESQHRVVCPDSVDCCTQGMEQHPSAISPRTPFDVAPQSLNTQEVCHVVLTEGGLMTEIDVAAHLAKAKGQKEGFTWTEFRDCFITFSVDQAQDSPIQFLSIVEFLMTDENGFGTTNLEDAMELLFRRFGVPTDSMFVKLFGNECDPTTQIPLAEYLAKVDVLIKERTGKRSQTSSRAISRNHSVHNAAAKNKNSHARGGGGLLAGQLRDSLKRA